MRLRAFAVMALAGLLTPFGSAARAGTTLGCELVSPQYPLTATALSKPWRFEGCSETDTNNAAFVQATIFDPATNTVSVYNPLVMTDGTSPAIAPTPVTLPPNAVVALWVGSNSSVDIGGWGYQWTRGIHSPDSLFGQQAYLNVPAFDKALNQAIAAGTFKVPSPGVSPKDGLPCPTARDFSIVDQDPSDNTTASYLFGGNGRTAQDTPANRTTLGITTFTNGVNGTFNGSDERLLTAKIDLALGCSPWTVPDRADPNGTLRSTDGLLNEFQAAAYQQSPVALIPAHDPFTLLNGQPNLKKLNTYRAQVDQPPATDLNGDVSWCNNLLTAGDRLNTDQSFTDAVSSPFPDIAITLWDFLGYRYSGTWDMIGCTGLMGVSNPVTLTYNASGVVNGATFS